MLYLYAFVRGLDELPDVGGLEGARPRLLRLGALDAVVTAHEWLEPEIAAESLGAHAATVDALMAATGELVPVRFGSVFDDERSLEKQAADREPALLDVLDRVRGRVEFGLHVVRTRSEARADPAPAGPRDRLLGRRDRLRAAERAARLDEPLVALAVDSRRRLLRTPRLLLSAVYLVQRGRSDEFGDRCREILEARPEGLEVLATGPWPPYSFAELEDGLRAA